MTEKYSSKSYSHSSGNQASFDITNKDEFINNAIELARCNGLDSLTRAQRIVFLIAEAEVDCDMNGIDTFLDRYGAEWLLETAEAFEVVGAIEIANTFLRIREQTDNINEILDLINHLIAKRTGYDESSIIRVIEAI